MILRVQVKCFAYGEKGSDYWTAPVLIKSAGEGTEFDQQLFGDLEWGGGGDTAFSREEALLL